MKDIAEFQDQIEANAYRDELRSEGINAEVDIFSQGKALKFFVKVPEEQYAQVPSDEIPPPPMDEEPTVKCPHCGSVNVKPSDALFLGIFGIILFIPLVIQFVRQKRDGIPYTCNDCKGPFRFKL